LGAASDPCLEGTLLILILGVLLMSFSFRSLEQVSRRGSFSFSGVITESGVRRSSPPVFCGVFDVRMDTSLFGDRPISLQALRFSLGMIRLLKDGSLTPVLLDEVRGVELCCGLEVLLILSLICPVGVSVLSVTENIDWNLPGELRLTLTGAEEDFSGVLTGLGGLDLVFFATILDEPMSTISWESFRSLTTTFLEPLREDIEVLGEILALFTLANRNLLVTEELLVILELSLKLVSEPVESKSGNSA